jgi:hypothetical protein
MKKLIHSIICLSLATTANAQLIAHWDFNNGNTTEKVHGWTPTGNSVGGTPTATAGKSGAANAAVKFNGSQNLVYAHDTLMNLKSWTFVAIVRPDNFYSGTCQNNVILWRANQYSAQHYQLDYFDNWVDNDCNIFTPDSLVFAASAAGSIAFANSEWSGGTNKNPRLKKGQWYCVVAKYDNTTGYMDLYIDGTLRVSEHGPSPNLWPDQYNYSLSPVNDLIIGSTNNPSGTYPYWLDGAVDDIKIYKGALANVDSFCAIGDAVNNESIEPGIQIFPNPATNIIQIQTPASAHEHASIVLMNSVGVVVQQQKTDRTSLSAMNIAHLPAGVYIVSVKLNGETYRQKLVKQ